MTTTQPRVNRSVVTSLRIFLTSTLILSLLVIPNRFFLQRSEAGGVRPEPQRVGHPKPGKPEATLPNLDQTRKQRQIERELPVPVPSTMRSPKIAEQPWNGRRFGEKEPKEGKEGDEPGTKEPGQKRAHAAKRPLSPPPVLDDTFIDNFYSYALPSYTPLSSEKPYWRDELRAGNAHGQGSLLLAAIEMGKTLFESSAYAARGRTDSQYVWDLYQTYLMRDASLDPSGWSFWTSGVANNGRENVRRAFEESTEFATLVNGFTFNGSPSGSQYSFITSRVDPRTQPGNGLLTRDVNWSVPILSLPGRSGLDLGLSLSYSSQVWTRSGPFVYFDEDNGFPSAGFRLGFPVVQRKVYDAQANTNSYLLILPNGRRVDLRQVGTTNVYEAGDSSYLQLTDNGTSWLVRSTDGTQLTYNEHNNEYHCIQVKDRNGNYLSVSYDAWGHPTTVTDTLGRVITFNYDTNHNLQTITQTWNGSTHTWATFGWGTQTIGFSFSSSLVIGASNSQTVPVLNQVALNDGTYYQFDYSSYVEASAIKRYHVADSPAILRAQTWYSFDAPAMDSPRMASSNLNVYNWTGINGIPGNVTTQYSDAGSNSYTMTMPDGTLYKEFYGSGWLKGLLDTSEIWSGGVKQKWVTNSWTQDNTSVGYETNPRVTENNIYDKDGNRKRTTTDYWSTFGLPHVVAEWDAAGTNVLRYTNYDYHNESDYVDRRIIGLPFRVDIKDSSWNIKSRTQYIYDWGGSDLFVDTPAAATQHDRTNYGPSFTVGRGNLALVQRYDVNDLNNTNGTATETKYRVNSTGSLLMVRDHLWHQKYFAYGDSFSDSVNRNTFAYPTTLTDEDGNNTTLQYNYDFGAATRTQGPPPAGQSQGIIKTMSYYSTTGQLDRVTTTNNGAYKRFYYGPDYVGSYATINTVADEAYEVHTFDGLGREFATASNFPGSTGGYKVKLTQYDIMGRLKQFSNPTEANSSWAPAGDDAAGWLYTQQTYDWKGRPLVTTNQDSTTRSIDYSGCGCAGGEVATLTDEGTTVGGVSKKRQRKIYADVLGRTVKTEDYNWDGTGAFGTAPGNTVYRATVNTYDMLDHVTQVRQYAGPEGSGTYQDTVMTYDGLGRLQTKHRPEQNTGTATVWTYNADNTVNTITNARGAVTTYGYNGRHLVTSITSALSGSSTISITNGYDAAGNRTSMSHTVGGVANDSASFSYDQLSRVISETRTINAVGSYAPNYGTYTIGYSYTLSNALQSVTDPFGSPTNFTYDNTGRTSTVTGTWNGTNYTYVNNVGYRAWGGVKSGVTGTTTYNSRMQPTHFSAGGMNYDYNYFADGKLKELRDLNDQVGDPHVVQFHYMSRAYSYDQVERIAAVGQASSPSVMPPFTAGYGYDAFDNMTSRSGQYALNPAQSDSGTYVNNRRNGWTYNAEGQVTNSTDSSDSGGSSTRSWTYDASGALVFNSEVRNGQTKTLSTSYDADGRLLGEIINGTSADYMVNSVVLGGALTKLTVSGGKDTTYVPANGLIHPMQVINPFSTPSAYLVTMFRDPAGVQENSNGFISAIDPLGNLIQNVQPPIGGPPSYIPFGGASYGGLSAFSYTNANNMSTGCYSASNSTPSSCSNAMLQRMGWDFVSGLPGFRGDLAMAENLYGVRADIALGHPAKFDEDGKPLFNHPVDNQLFEDATQNPGTPSKKEADFLNAAIKGANKRLENPDCLKIFKDVGGAKVDPGDYFANHTSIGDKTPHGAAFQDPLRTLATTASDYDAKGKRLPSGETVFNIQSVFFSDTFTLKSTSTLYGLSRDEVRELAVLHEYFHIADVNGKFDDDTGDPTVDSQHSKAISDLIRINCGFPQPK